jgi:hypothetical protein
MWVKMIKNERGNFFPCSAQAVLFLSISLRHFVSATENSGAWKSLVESGNIKASFRV